MNHAKNTPFLAAIGFIGDRVEEAGRNIAIAKDSLLALLDAPHEELHERVSEILEVLDAAAAALEWEETKKPAVKA